MKKFFDIKPPRPRPVSTLEPLPSEHSAYASLAESRRERTDPGISFPLWRPDWPHLAQKIIIVIKSSSAYFLVGMMSFIFFSGLFYGYNRYQEGRRQAAKQSQEVSGAQATKPHAMISLRVLNGSGSAEQLAALRAILEDQGYVIRTTGTASYPTEKTVIFYRQGAEDQALGLAADLERFAPSLQKNDDLAGIDDIVVLLGRSPDLRQQD